MPSYPTILFNSSTGSDAAASGAGPATAVTGTAAAHTGGAASTTITLTGSPDLSGVATDGSHCLWMKTASGRQFSKITGADNVGKTISVEDSFTIAEASAVNYAVGGKRATWDDADSRNLRSDAKAGWTIETETNQTISSVITGNCSGSNNIGRIIWKGSNGSIKTITQSSNAPHFTNTTSSNPTLWMFQNLKFNNSNATKNESSVATTFRNANIYYYNCIFGDSANKLYNGISSGLSETYSVMVNCEFSNMVSDGFLGQAGGTEFIIKSCWIHHCGGHGINSPLGRYYKQIISNCIINNNTGSGINSSNNDTAYGFIIESCTIYGNGADGINLSAGWQNDNNIIQNNCISSNAAYGLRARSITNINTPFIDFNNYHNNTSGAYLNISAGANDLAVDPQYKDAANGDFTIGTNLKAKGFPGSENHIGINSATHSYTDIGAAQRKESMRRRRG